MIRVRVLGPLVVRSVEGPDVRLRQGRPRRLLLALVLQRGGAVSASALIDHLWADAPPRNPANALHILVSYLRKALQAAAVGVEHGAGGYRLVLPASGVDMFLFEDLLDRLRRPGLAAEDALSLATEALGLWRGAPLPEAADDLFAHGDVARLWELHQFASAARCRALLALRRHDEAVADLSRLAREHPYREDLQELLAVGLYRSGRQVEALDTLARARDRLARDLGLDPSPLLHRLEHRILNQDPGLDPTADLAPAPPAPAASRLRRRQPPTAGPPTPMTTVVGRAG